MSQDFGTAQIDKSIDGNPITLAGHTYAHGVGTHADSIYEANLEGRAARFDATVGVDDETKGRGAVVFEVAVDGTVVAKTGILHSGDAPATVSVPLTKARKVELIVLMGDKNIAFDHADWADARFVLADGQTALPPQTPAPPSALDAPARLRILPDSPAPAIHGPRVTGATPGRPFLFRIPATGQTPLTFSAKGLPRGLALDPQTGIISGKTPARGVYAVTIAVRNSRGTAHRPLTIVCGAHKLALTPPMGWNSWNVWGTKIDEDKVVAAARAMVSSGLAAHGYQYVNVDDAWEAKRDASGDIESNASFPDMRRLTSSVHGLGLKVGIYSSPGPTTCGGFTASYQHEQQDANRYAAWGFDYVKYDWCSYGGVAANDSVPELQKPYRVMRTALDRTGRDIVFSLCQYGMGEVWKWGVDVGGNCWRTCDDINDSWSSLHSIYESENGRGGYAGPGHWNDPDMLVVGQVGWGNPHPSHLTQNEQILHISMWCLFAAPMIVGCDLDRLDPFTTAILSNDEAIDIDQDPLGKPARMVTPDQNGGEVWARPLWDGRTAVGLVNPYAWPRRVGVRWSSIGLSGRQPVRDVWLHEDEGTRKGGYTVVVPAHGCVLLTIGHAKG
jgi:alpha-galactosidase